MNNTVAAQVQARFQKGLAFHQAGQLAQARKHYELVLKAQPRHFDSLHMMGVIAFQTGNPVYAVDLIGRAIQIDPGNAAAYYNRGGALQELGRLEEALASYEQAVALTPDYPEAYYARGNTLRALKRLHGALASYDQAIAIVPDYAEAWSNRGNTLQELGQLDDALASYEQAIRIRPDFAEAYGNRRSALRELNRIDDALASYEQAMALKADFADACGALQELKRLNEELAGHDEAIARKPDAAEAHYERGNTLHALGRLGEALASFEQAIALKPDLAAAHINRGNTLQELGQLDAALESFEQVIALRPDSADAYYNRGNVINELARPDEALASYDQAIAWSPGFAEAWSNRGIALQQLGRLDEALASHERAVALKSEFAEGHFNRGVTLQELNRPEDALATYDRAIKVRPAFAEACRNRGNALLELERPEEALASYRRALEIKPDYVEAHNNLASLFNGQGKWVMALNAVKQSLKIGETEEARRLFSACVRHLNFTRDDSEVRIALVRALTEPWARPGDLAVAAASLIKLNPAIEKFAAREGEASLLQPAVQDFSGLVELGALSGDHLLCALLNSAPVCDLELERFLKMARHAMLESARGTTTSEVEAGAALRFCSALARQCFINEYVFSHTDEEIRQAGDLRDALVAALEANTQVPLLWPLAVAAFFPLSSLLHADRLLNAPWPEEILTVLEQQVREPAQELQLRDNMPRLTAIEDAVSLAVRTQYEQNPYPRWVKAAPAEKGKNLIEQMCNQAARDSVEDGGKAAAIEILVAGCGTGQHPIGTAQLFRNAKVLAVDLSLSSLGYAKRKTLELGLTSIDYAQADILKLGSLDRRFDVIESSGVLHHLADPWSGWKVLLSLLRPSGFMKLGLYSELGRRNIVRLRSHIASRGYGASTDDIRRCRHDLMSPETVARFGLTLGLPDFFSTSTCRDLLFHVQEHRVTLTAIDAFLRANNLSFMWFQMEGDVVRAYKRRFPNDHDAIDLVQWQTFENENPDTFLGMYQFWVQKGDKISDTKDSGEPGTLVRQI